MNEEDKIEAMNDLKKRIKEELKKELLAEIYSELKAEEIQPQRKGKTVEQHKEKPIQDIRHGRKNKTVFCPFRYGNNRHVFTNTGHL